MIALELRQNFKEKYIGHTARVLALQLRSIENHNHLYSFGYDGLLITWDLETSKIKTMYNIFEVNYDLTFNQTSIRKALFYKGILITGHSNGLICTWVTSNGRIDFAAKGHKDYITAITISQNDHIMISSMDESISVFDPYVHFSPPIN